MVERQARDQTVAGSIPDRSSERIFFFLCRLLFGVRSNAVLSQWQVKDPCDSSKTAGDRLHLNTHTPLTRRSLRGLIILSRHSVGTSQENELTRNSLGNVCPYSFQLAESLWTYQGVKSGISVRKLISSLKKERKRRRKRGMILRTFPTNPRMQGKS